MDKLSVVLFRIVQIKYTRV